ncbi:MAG: DEAD/DEAH box helicase [Magnetococcales bacterium]|nr:DEAD/DEAH box helicase [Magnetococcales bacterium]
MSTSTPPADRATLLAAFERLPPLERAVLQLLSIVSGPLNRTDLSRLLGEAGVTGSQGKALSATTLTPVVHNLIHQEMLQDNMHLFSCNNTIAWEITRSAVEEGSFKQMAPVVQKFLPAIVSYSFRHRGHELFDFTRCLREIRIALFAQDVQRMEQYLLWGQEQYPEQMMALPPLIALCANPFDPVWFASLPLAIQIRALEDIVPFFIENFALPEEIPPLLWRYRALPVEQFGERFRALLVTALLLEGELTAAQSILLGDAPVANQEELHGWLLFLQGDNTAAIQRFDAALQALRKTARTHKTYFSHWAGPFFLLALLKTQDPIQHSRIAELAAIAQKKNFLKYSMVYYSLEALLWAQKNEVTRGLMLLTLAEHRDSLSASIGQLLRRLHPYPVPRLGLLFKSIVHYWIQGPRNPPYLAELKAAFAQAQSSGCGWAAMELAELLSRLEGESELYTHYATEKRAQTGVQSIVPIVAKEASWERALRALLQLTPDGSGKRVGKTGTARRLIWLIEVDGPSVTSIQPKEQSQNSHGGWSKGRLLPLTRLLEKSEDLTFLTEQDWRISRALERVGSSYGRTRLLFNWEQAMLAMVGHPLVFWETQPTVNVEVVRVEPELLVHKDNHRIQVQFSQSFSQPGVMVSQVSPTRCQLIEVTATHKAIADILGEKGLHIPSAGTAQLLNVVQALSALVTIQSAIAGDHERIETLPADAIPRVQLLPFGTGLKMKLLVRPFGQEGPYFIPGKGGQTIIAEVGGKRLQTHRMLQDERARALEVLTACPSLATGDEILPEWYFDDPEACLELLTELQGVAHSVRVEWPEGEKLRVTAPLSMEHLRVQVQRDRDWFALTGELSVDESSVVEMNRLLELVLSSRSRFIALGEGQFLTLTEKFRRQLLELQAFSNTHGQGRRFHPLAAPVVQEITEQAQWNKVDKQWRQHLQRMEAAQTLTVALPSTLQVELREYQVSGFHWLARLAAWGVGACLADDMGLGKTVQALALLVSRAAEGPVLVVAPTSVCWNWLREIEQFAPTLRGIYFTGGQRQQTLNALQPFDVLICSYGLLQQEEEMLASVRWNVLVLDEAQAIKNRGTKRSKAAMALQASFKMILTGTPIENHLGELWNLFHFINPGLLGTPESYNERFATPIERHGSKEARHRLKKLLQPFILRRTKSQVLEELPSRTEIVLHVEMSEEERVFYESLRRRALEQIENLQGPPEQKQLQIFAELMRLRRACCNSRLILPDSTMISSKLELFWSVVEGLLENRHKVLVFSQFVDHLAIIRERLESQSVRYQYLDGSTPIQERQRRVEAFQAGEGDLFLISLRAGGMGINLTAADYVIHMDPWWNPAVEDQAADRAHRIGQLRPVTIYRLVTQGTIEEMIVDLHQHKRNLADGLLDGSDVSGKLSTEDLLRIIRGQDRHVSP